MPVPVEALGTVPRTGPGPSTGADGRPNIISSAATASMVSKGATSLSNKSSISSWSETSSSEKPGKVHSSAGMSLSTLSSLRSE